MCSCASATPPESKVRRSFVSLPVPNPERLKTAKALVDKAVKVSYITGCSQNISTVTFISNCTKTFSIISVSPVLSSQMHKIFSVQGPYPVIRAALRARGWVEQRIHRPNHHAHLRHSDEGRASSNDAGDSDDDDGELDARMTVSEIIFLLDICSYLSID